MKLNQRIHSLRIKCGLTQKELSEIIGVSVVSIGGWENGTRKPSAEAVIALAKALNVTTDYLLGRTNERNPKKERFQDVDTIAAHRIGNIEQLSDEGLEELDNYIELLKLKYKK